MSMLATRAHEPGPRIKPLVGYGLALTILLAAGIFQYKIVGALVEADIWIIHAHEVLAELEGVCSGLQQAEWGTQSYASTGVQDYVIQFSTGIGRADEHLRAARMVTADDPSQQQNFDRLMQLVSTKRRVMEHLIALRRDQGHTAASEALSNDEGLKLMTEIRALTDEMEGEENSLLEARQAASRSQAKRADLAILFGTVLALSLTLATSWVAHRDAIRWCRAEEPVQNGSLHSRSLIETSLDPLVTISRGGKITDVNQATEFVTGVARQQLIGSDFSAYFTEPEEARKVYEQVLARGSVRNHPLVIRDISGKLTDVLYNATVFKSDAGEVEGIFAAARDVTERKRAEQALRESEDAFRSLAELVPQLVWVCTHDGLGIYFNQRWVDYTGLTLEESYGKGWNTAFHLDGKQPTLDVWNHTAAIGNTYRFESRLRARDGHDRWFLTNGVSLTDGAGRVLRWFGTCTDIEDLKRSEEALRMITADLARSNADLEQFAYVASHDLQEPLRMVASFTQLLGQRYKGQLDADADEFIGYAVDGARRMQALVNDLLYYSRVGTRGKELVAVDFEQVLQMVLTNLQARLEESGGQVTHDPLPTVMGDETQLWQVLQNLVGNALKFHSSEPPRVHVSAQEIEGEWRFSVRDNGIGIEPQFAKRIFLVFQRLHSRAEYPGTGLGLAIAKKILERQGGRIWMESEPGKGSTFYFSLPKIRSDSCRQLQSHHNLLTSC
jgi:PAS domain S-box-containing protein